MNEAQNQMIVRESIARLLGEPPTISSTCLLMPSTSSTATVCCPHWRLTRSALPCISMSTARERKDAELKACLADVVGRGLVEDNKKNRKKRRKLLAARNIEEAEFDKHLAKFLEQNKGADDQTDTGVKCNKISSGISETQPGAAEEIEDIFVDLKKRKLEAAEREAEELEHERKRKAARKQDREESDTMNPIGVDADSGLNVYSLDTLRKNNGGAPGEGGGTALCPFDCKCCY
jgi:hypothetical protein